MAVRKRSFLYGRVTVTNNGSRPSAVGGRIFDRSPKIVIHRDPASIRPRPPRPRCIVKAGGKRNCMIRPHVVC